MNLSRTTGIGACGRADAQRARQELPTIRGILLGCAALACGGRLEALSLLVSCPCQDGVERRLQFRARGKSPSSRPPTLRRYVG